MIYIGVGLGGMIGSLLRYYISLGANGYFSESFPFGTLIANLAGSMFLGWFTSKVAAQSNMNPILITAIGTGITGSFTTFSTFSLESLALIESGRIGAAIFYILVSAIGGLFLAAAGYYIGLNKPGRGEVSG